MQITGRRICIAGSASAETDVKLLTYAHQLMLEIVRTLVNEGALLLCGVGNNPRQSDVAGSLSLIFDWTILDFVSNELTATRLPSERQQGRILAAVLTSKTASQIPPDKQDVWKQLVDSDAVNIQYIRPGWSSGAVRRAEQASISDLLIAVGGGEGVEHLAQEFIRQGKPVIPLDLDLGASKEDGSGGAHRLFREIRHRPDAFIKTLRPERIGTILTRMETDGGRKETAKVVQAVMDLIKELRPPDAFYVRLLDPKSTEFGSVETYFRQVVDPLVTEFGYNIVEMGRTEASSPWMNAQIFEKIHYSAVTIVDLTGARPNCLMELGYAFGRERKVIITAKEGTSIPFDASPIEVRMWNEATADTKRIEQLRDYWKRNINRPPLVPT